MGVDLCSRDLRGVLDVVRALQEGWVAEASGAAVASLGRLIGCDNAACLRVEAATRQTLDAVTERSEHVMRDPRFGELIHQHPGCIAYYGGRMPLGTAAALTDLASTQALHRIPLYTDLYVPFGTSDELLCMVPIGDRQVGLLTLSRSRYGFSRRDRLLAELLAPHVAQLLALRQRHAATQRAGFSPGQIERAAARWSALTAREQQVAVRVSRGDTDREIARTLAISPRTVHKHLENIYRKLDLTNRTGLIAAMACSSYPEQSQSRQGRRFESLPEISGAIGSIRGRLRM